MTQATDDWLDRILTVLENRVASDTQQRIVAHYAGKSPKSIHAQAKQAILAHIEANYVPKENSKAYRAGYHDGRVFGSFGMYTEAEVAAEREKAARIMLASIANDQGWEDTAWDYAEQIGMTKEQFEDFREQYRKTPIATTVDRELAALTSQEGKDSGS